MLIPADAVEALTAAGLVVEATGADSGLDLVLRERHPREGETRRVLQVQIKRYSRPLSVRDLGDLVRLFGHEILFVVPRASAAARNFARERGVSLISLDRDTPGPPTGHVAWGPGDVVSIGARAQVTGARDGWQARPSWGAWAVQRALLLTTERRQTHLSAMTGLSQPRVSQIYKDLTELGLVRREGSAASSVEVEWPELLSHWLGDYPGAGGVSTYWFGLDPVARQARTAASHLGRGTGAALVSGDVAADELSPWAQPTLALVYAMEGADLSGTEFTPSTPAEATLVVTVPEDPTVWRSAGWGFPAVNPKRTSGFPLADPLQIVFDLGRSRAVDADQARDHFAERLRSVVTASARGTDA